MNVPDAELDVVGRLAEAFLARYRCGERPPLTEYTDQYPELAEQIRELFPALVVLEELGSVAGPQRGASTGTVPGRVPERLGDYRILREVGRGGMGIVYEAVQESLGRHVALKVLSCHGLLPPTHLERFRREARAAARLHHTNIVPVHGVGEHEGVPYYAMQFIDGRGLDEVLTEVKRLRGARGPSTAEDPGPSADQSQSLAQGLLSGSFAGAGASDWEGEAPAEPPSVGRISIRPEGPDGLKSVLRPTDAPTAPGSANGSELTAQPGALYFRSVAQMGVQVAAGLDYAHQQGILHRDIKPSNLLLDARGTVWITDFGLAKTEGTDELSRAGDIVGTLRYMAPERFHGLSDPRSDVYGLGITLYELLTLRPAFEDSSRHRLIERVTHEDPPRPRKVDRSIPRDLETIVLKAIAKEPGRRYQTAAELAEDLDRFLAGEPVRARRIGIGERAVKWVKRRPAVAALLAVSAAAGLALTVGTLAHNARLGVALQDAQANLDKAKRAEQAMTRQLAIAQLREAQARRHGGLMGRRFESLETLQKAAEHFRALGELDEQRSLELRNEAIACLALADLKPEKEGIQDPGWSRHGWFDPTLQYYVVRSTADGQREKSDLHQGHLSVRRVADDQEIARLPGFGVLVVATRFSPDGRYLAVHYEAGQRHTYVWDVSRREAILKVSQDRYDSFPSFSPDSRLVALPQPDRSIRIWELPSGTPWKDLPPALPVASVHFHPNGRQLAVVSGSLVQLRDLSDGKEVTTFQHPGSVATLTWRSDGKAFATGCYENDIYLWDVANSAQPLRILKGHFGAVVDLSFSQGGDLLFSNSWDSTDRLWDPMTGQQLFSKPGGVYREHFFGPDDQKLVEGWQVATGRECRTFHGPNRLSWVAISPRGRLMASVCTEGVQLWDLAATREGDKLLGTLRVGSSMAVHFDPKGESLITDSKSVGLQRWPLTPDPQTGGLRIGPPQSLGLSARAPFFGNDPDFALSADGRTVAHSPQRGQVLLYNLENPRRKLLIESPYLRAAAFSPDGRWLATGNWQGRGVKVWDAQTGKLAHDFDLGESGEKAAWPAFSPDGQWLVTSTSAESRFWEVGSWHKKHGLPRANAGQLPGWIVFSPDGQLLAVPHSMTEVRLVDPATGREFARLPTAGRPYCFSPDGSQLVTYAGRDGAFQVWDLRLIRQQLQEMDLDWDLPPYPPPSPLTPLPEGEGQGGRGPLRVQVLAAEPPPPAKELDAEAHLERGLLCVQLRQYAQAVDDFQRASDLDPKRSPWAEVVRAYAQAIERHPDAEAYHQRAHVHERLGQWQEALDDYSQAIQQAPQNLAFHICRGRAYLRLGQKDKAAEDFAKVRELKPEPANRLAWELATAPNAWHREPSLAVELAQQAVRQTPGEARYWNTLGVAHYRLGEWRAALQALEESEKLAPGKYISCNAFFLAMCHDQLGDTVQARNHYDRAVRWCQDNQGKLSTGRQQELKALHAEVEALLKGPSPGP